MEKISLQSKYVFLHGVTRLKSNQPDKTPYACKGKLVWCLSHATALLQIIAGLPSLGTNYCQTEFKWTKLDQN